MYLFGAIAYVCWDILSIGKFCKMIEVTSRVYDLRAGTL
jgi:hypothetical protein